MKLEFDNVKNIRLIKYTKEMSGVTNRRKTKNRATELRKNWKILSLPLLFKIKVK